MPVLQAEQLGDLVATTLRELNEPNFTELATDLQDHVVQRVLLKKSNVKMSSGYGIQFDVMIDHAQSARNVGLYATDQVNQRDVMIQAQSNIRHTTANWAIDGREIDMNSGKRQIVDLVRARRSSCLIALAELMETNFWQFPSATDTTTPSGLPYWVTKNATTGFNGGIPTGYSNVANVSPTTYPRWNNYTYQYTAVTRDDFVRGARAAATKTDFRPAIDGLPTLNTGDSYGFYANYAVVGLLEELAESQNDNLGPDVASKDGQAMFRRTSVTYVPKLDADTTNPFYGINWGTFKTYILPSWWMKQTQIPVKNDQHTVSVNHIDCGYQWVCVDRRRNMVLATGTTYPS